MRSSEITHFDYLIVGSGLVANFAAEGIRERDTVGTIGILSEDVEAPIAGPTPSAKSWTDPTFTLADAWFDSAATNRADLHLETTVTEIDRDAHVVHTESGETYTYRNLLLATGGRPAYIDLPEDDRVIRYRSTRDHTRLRELCEQCPDIAVIGNGYVGTELAAALAQNGCSVTLITPNAIVGASVLPPSLARPMDAAFLAHGVDVRRGIRVTSGVASAAGITLTLDDGSTLLVGAVVSGLGTTPNVELAQAAGLEIADGVLVDENLVTSDPHIFAAGDVAQYPDALVACGRVEHMNNATAMGHTAGHNMAGDPQPYDYTPYYYAVIFGNRYEAVGVVGANLEIVEDLTPTNGVIYYLSDGLVIGVMLWNMEGRLDAARQAITEASSLTRADLEGLIRP